MRIEVSKGELIDKITILEIKDERVDDYEKLKKSVTNWMYFSNMNLKHHGRNV